MQLIYLFFAFVFGSIVGSFLNVVILRLPKEQSLGGRSHCTSCGRVLGFWELFPMFSFLFLGGKCRYCGAKISARYFFIETITGILFAAIWFLLKPNDLADFLLLFKYWTVTAVLLCVFVIDLEHYLILDQIIIFGVITAALFNLAWDLTQHHNLVSLQGNFANGLLSAILAPLPFLLIWAVSKGRWMGFGDVKFMAFLGLALGWPNILAGFMIAVFSGGLVSALLLAFTKKTLKSQIPFGTFLSVGAFLALLYGQQLVHWYLAFLGLS